MSDSPEPDTKDTTQSKEAPKKKFAWLSWERDVEILKIAVTFYAACIGTFVTFQFNERQHELARIEAIAKMLPSLSSGGTASSDPAASPAPSTPSEIKDDEAAAEKLQKSQGKPHHGGSNSHLSRDGAMWAIFRTANNKTMLRDLAALFPEDIYRVVSSIAAAGEITSDKDVITALQVSSEKLANKFAASDKTEMAGRLYDQALRLKEHQNGTPASFTIIDINDEDIESPPTEDHILGTLRSLNRLADMHRKDAEEHKVSTARWNAKQLYKRVRALGTKATSKEERLEVAKADLALANLYLKDHRPQAAIYYLKDALTLNEQALGPNDRTTAEICRELSGLLRTIPEAAQEADDLKKRADEILGPAKAAH